MLFRLLFIGSLFICHAGNGQYFVKEKRLSQQVLSAVNDSVRIIRLGELADFYYIYRDENKGDSVLQRQLLLAELSENKNLIFNAFFGKALTNLNTWSSTKTFDRAIAFLNKGLSYAREMRKKDYEALAYIRIASLYRKREQYSKALEQATLGLSSTTESVNDSLKCMVFLEIGDIFLAKGDAVSAYKNYNNAFDLAYDIKNIGLQSETYHHIATMYDSQHLKDIKLVKKNLLKSFELNRENGNQLGLLQDYRDLARNTEEKEYLSKYMDQAIKAGTDRDILSAKNLMFVYLMVMKKNTAETMTYLLENEDLNQSYLNTGMANYYWKLGNIYQYSERMDSAIYYYSLALPGMEKNYDLDKQKALFMGLADCYRRINQPQKSIEFYEKAVEICKECRLKTSADIYDALSSLYAQTGDYKKAFQYQQQYLHYNDTVQKMAAQRDVVLLEVERENNKHEKDLATKAANELRLRNLQYMGISIAIAAVFMFMVLLGMFPVSKFTIKLLGFMAFICLFEFIILLIENSLHRITHGEPLKIWLLKIVLIAAIVPLHHSLEQGVVRFLASQRLLQIRQKISNRKFWLALKMKITKPPALTEAAIEEDALV
jgi:hypothetical protein